MLFSISSWGLEAIKLRLPLCISDPVQKCRRLQKKCRRAATADKKCPIGRLRCASCASTSTSKYKHKQIQRIQRRKLSKHAGLAALTIHFLIQTMIGKVVNQKAVQATCVQEKSTGQCCTWNCHHLQQLNVNMSMCSHVLL